MAKLLIHALRIVLVPRTTSSDVETGFNFVGNEINNLVAARRVPAVRGEQVSDI